MHHRHLAILVIRYRLKELIADRAFRLGRIVTMDEVARETGLHRMTLSRMANIRGYVTRTDILDKLCEYFGCRLEELAQHIPSSEEPTEPLAVNDMQ
jgi:putative transcriptional regulator